MIQLRLFRASEPFQQVDERSLLEGELVIGRDPSANWMIPDESREVSRHHCTIALREGGVMLRDTSSNGVYLGDERRRVTPGAEHALDVFATFHLGQFMIVVEPYVPANDTAASEPSLFSKDVSAEALRVRSDWESDSEPTLARHPTQGLPTDAEMLDAFCAGAGLDSSSFIGEDPVQVMQRAGAIYKQMVLGLGDLMSERHSVKNDLKLSRTTVGAAGNNPFKWAPTRRVAIDLLRDRKDGFLSGPAALKASFEDLRKHAVCLRAGARASLDLVLERLAPDGIEGEVRGQSTLLLNKGEACWRLYRSRHGVLLDETKGETDGAANAAFKQGYERQLYELGELGTRS